MKIGIITFHRANNYGAVLQCYALQAKLQTLGYEAEVIDYRQCDIEDVYKPIRWNIIKKGLASPRLLASYLLKQLPSNFQIAILKKQHYNFFRNKYLICTDSFHQTNKIPQDFDIYLIGSDQMWSIDCTNQKIDDIYFGNFRHFSKSKIKSYAISTNVQALKKIGIQKLKDYILNFSVLSFREKEVCDWINKTMGINSRVDIDPTLLLNREDWLKFIRPRPVQYKYILTYFVSPIHNEKINRYAKKIGTLVIDIEKVALSPIEFLTYIYYAELIITSSFHATVFSIIFERPFYSLQTKKSTDVRYVDLLDQLGLISQYFDPETSEFETNITIDFNSAKSKLKFMQDRSVVYLSKICN